MLFLLNEYTFHFSNILIIGLYNSSDNSRSDIMSFLTALPEVLAPEDVL